MEENTNQTLRRLWDGYAEAGYDKADLTHSTKHLRKTMANLFANYSGGDTALNHVVDVIDIGCGTGGMFPTIIDKINPTNLFAVDHSEKMLARAKRRAETFRDDGIGNINFVFSQFDLTKPFPWSNDTFDVAVSNLVICYLPGGWEAPLKELCRVVKPGGWLYLSTFVNTWTLSKALSSFGLKEFVRAPVGTLWGIKLWRFVSGIEKEVKKLGAEYPQSSKLITCLDESSFKIVETKPVYFGFGLAIAAQKQPQVNTTA